MTRFERIKTIYTAIAPPGAGKTEAMLSKLPALLGSGERVILALPTLVLSDSLARRASESGVAYSTIDQRCGEAVVPTLEKALSEKTESFVICTQESIRQVRHDLLHGWILVVDELPKVVDYPDYALKPLELKRVFDFTEERDGQLWIRDGLEQTVQEQVSINRADARGTDCSTLGRSAAHIFRLLLSKVDVFIDQPQSDSVRHIRAVEEFTDWWDIFSSATESHVLAASIQNSEFEVFAMVYGFHFKRSEFTPEGNPLTSFVTIYPVVQTGQKFSKGMMLNSHEGERLIDVVLKKALEQTKSTPLLFANKWARLQLTRNVEYAPKDCRGLNSYSHATEAIVLFGGNPSPSDSKGIKYLSAKYGKDFEEAFITTRFLEPSLQAVTRTAVRCYDNNKDVHFYVQDHRVVDYLRSTYFPDATVDWFFAGTVPIKRDGRKLDEKTEEEVKRLISLETSTLQIHRETGVSRQKIKKMKEIYNAA
jgi:hypothetical protein